LNAAKLIEIGLSGVARLNHDSKRISFSPVQVSASGTRVAGASMAQ
jgi:hypothetical protein